VTQLNENVVVAVV